ncbi:glycolate oxidase subunit GlcE [Hahella sp. NBU794]|uniref:glycolate oxidase subunit GlcE n=1 Tax=Hahella sp. NBU794 TaxID=3422590 RepID=UPI003D6EE712
MTDIADRLVEQVMTARAASRPLMIRGGGSKTFLGRAAAGEAMDLSEHSGVVDYSPSELVITARAGTRIADVRRALDEQGQMLPFEPPEYEGRATLGGALAANTSGPARPWRGSVRDALLGTRIINGKGEHLRFGGVVMKNVAGYDLSRAHCGAMGSLGVITELSIRVIPKPELETTLVQECNEATAITKMVELCRQPRPLSAVCWTGGRLYLRLSGAEQAVASTIGYWGGELLERAADFWRQIQEQTHEFFEGETPLWRLSVKPSAPPLGNDAPVLLDWGGALRWVRAESSLTAMERYAVSAQGQASLYRHGDHNGEVYHRLSPPLRALHQRLKAALDPDGIFNPGRLYSWL